MAGEIEVRARGHLGADAVVKLVNGREVAEISVAVGVRRKDATSGEWQDVRTDWIRVTCWDRLVGPVSTLSKGVLVEVVGRLTASAYLKDGEARQSLDVTARDVFVVPRAPRADVPASPALAGQPF